jgi:N utilization substance protein B
MLYAIDLGRRGPTADAALAEEVFQSVCENFELPEGARVFAKELVTGVTAEKPGLDAQIARHAQRWRISRMAAVDRNVLRLGAFELLHSDAPSAVVIDEAVELARRFGGERSPGFVNGILDAIARCRERAEEAS